jgi:thiol:disulfide interchange protein DsbD
MLRVTRYLTIATILAGGSAYAQGLDPVKWTLAAPVSNVKPGGSIPLKLTATLEPGWHLYAPSTPPGGPIPTTLKLLENPLVENFTVQEPTPERKFDENFKVDVEWYQEEVTFTVPLQLKPDVQAGPAVLTMEARYQACNEKQCLPPRKKTASVTITIGTAAPAITRSLPKPPAALSSPPEKVMPTTTEPAPAPQSLPKPAASVAAVPAAPASPGGDMGRFLAIAFGLGLAAVFTPCVFPMIPITVSFFLNQQAGSRRASINLAMVFCGGIVLLFCAIGFGVTAIVGPFGVVQLGANPWVNGTIALVFLVFALSLLGAFEITLPSGLLTKLDSASRGGGYLGALIMGLTFSLTSFACVGPFLGTLLAASVQSKGMQPVLGMVLFAAGLATPFFFLALFPSFLQRLPRSGMWMVRVKIVFGFVILAAMLKYLSNVDQVLHINVLARPVYLAAWFVLFALPGLYLLGFLRMEGVKAEEHVGVARVLTASAFLIFAVSLLPGLLGASLGPVESYVPPPAGGYVAGTSGAESQVWLKNQYAEALAEGKRRNEPVLAVFTGYTCTNCHWMKANIFPRQEIASVVKNMVLVELYTDGEDEASQRNQELQDKLFHTVAIPFYALLDGDGQVLASFPGLTRDPKEFLSFLTAHPDRRL